jgi:hypothetical protein
VDLKIDPDGGHYASEFISIPKGTYEGKLVIGESFTHPVKKFTIEKDDDIVVLQFALYQAGSGYYLIKLSINVMIDLTSIEIHRFGQQQLWWSLWFR